MSADTLRQAAVLMRERAEAVDTAPDEMSGEKWTWQDGMRFVLRAPDAEHVAGWTPAVALPIAAWLDACAQFLEDEPDYTHDGEDYALAVATAYLGDAR